MQMRRARLRHFPSARERRPMTTLIRILVVMVFGTTTLQAQLSPTPVATTASAAPIPGPAPAPAPMPAPDVNVGGEATEVNLLVGRSTLIDVGAPIARVSLTSADIADAMVTASSQLLLHGKTPGSISMLVWNRAGAVSRFEVAVQRDLTQLTDQLKALFPNELISVHSNGRQVVLAGTASSQDVLDKAKSLAAGYVEKVEDVAVLMQLRAPRSNQVLLRVRFAEVSRNAMTELGASFFTSPTGLKNTLGRLTTQQFSAPTFEELQWSKQSFDFGAPVTSASGKFEFADFLNLFLFSEKYDLGLLVRALQNQGLFQSLAEPNLVAESGKEASFLAGGEFPVPIVQGNSNGVSVTFKEFGIRLNFTPTVDGDRVHLKVRPEVSTLDYGNAVLLSGFRIPSLTTRRTETSLELRDGQTFAIAGLINNQMNSTLAKIPGIGDIPILGNLFKSKAAQKGQTELVVMITPEILPVGSPGVTTNIPRILEPFLATPPEDRMMLPPPPAFLPGRPQMTPTPPEGGVPESSRPAPTAEERRIIETERLAKAVEARANAEAEKVAAREAARRAEEAARQQEIDLERATKAEEQARKDAERQQKADAERLESEAEQARKDQARQQKLEAERLKKDAEAAKKAEEQARKDAERQQKLDAERLRREAEAAKKAAEQAARDADGRHGKTSG